MLAIRCANKTFESHGRVTKAIDHVSFDINAGESVALIGASGSGKSTLMRAICGLEILDKTSGELLLDQQLIQSKGELSPHIRRIRQEMGVIFQQFNLVGQLDVLTNVLIGLAPQKNVFQIMTRRFSLEEKARGLGSLEKVGLVDLAYQKSSTLSGGQQQRVAIARALIKGAKIVLADEPVASLDPESSRKVMDTLLGLAKTLNLTLITSLHQIPIAQKYCERTIALSQGSVVFDGPTPHLDEAKLADLYGFSGNDSLN